MNIYSEIFLGSNQTFMQDAATKIIYSFSLFASICLHTIYNADPLNCSQTPNKVIKSGKYKMLLQESVGWQNLFV